jgi:hypothetical protein
VFSSFLSDAGRLQLTNDVLSALPTFAMCTFLLPKTVIKQIDKFRKHCLWRGSDPNSKKPFKAAWPLITLPKTEGGLGVLDLKLQNECLLLKNLHKFFNRDNIPWVQLIWNSLFSNNRLPNSDSRPKGSFWWRDSLKLISQFKDLAVISVRDGATCLLWHDKWDGIPLSLRFPELYSFCRNKNITLKTAASLLQHQSMFHLPLSTEAYGQFVQLVVILQNLHLHSSPDVWSYS